jgi:hypothetical protein
MLYIQIVGTVTTKFMIEGNGFNARESKMV